MSAPPGRSDGEWFLQTAAIRVLPTGIRLLLDELFATVEKLFVPVSTVVALGDLLGFVHHRQENGGEANEDQQKESAAPQPMMIPFLSLYLDD